VVAEIDLYRKKVLISPLKILYYLQADILITERFKLPHRLSELIRILSWLVKGRRLYRRSQVVDFTCVAVGSVLGRRVIRLVKVALEVTIVVAIANELAVLASYNVVNNIPAAVFCDGGVPTIVIIVALVVERSLLCIRIGILPLERILKVSASWYVDMI
jgi:hypothetical protein